VVVDVSATPRGEGGDDDVERAARAERAVDRAGPRAASRRRGRSVDQSAKSKWSKEALTTSTNDETTALVRYSKRTKRGKEM
jgi:hypothetical protein